MLHSIVEQASRERKSRKETSRLLLSRLQAQSSVHIRCQKIQCTSDEWGATLALFPTPGIGYLCRTTCTSFCAPLEYFCHKTPIGNDISKEYGQQERGLLGGGHTAD